MSHNGEAFWRESDGVVEVGCTHPAIKIETGTMNPVVAKELTPFLWEGERIYAIIWNKSFHDARFDIGICDPDAGKWMTYNELLRAVKKSEVELCELFDMSRKYFEPF